MDRDATAAVLAELAKTDITVGHLYRADFDSSPVYISSFYKDIVYDSNTYLPNGHFIQFEPISESGDLSHQPVRITLSGVDQTWVSIVLTQQYIDRRIRIYLAFLDSSEALIVDPMLIFDGKMNKATIVESPASGESSVQVEAAWAFATFDAPRGRRTNHQEQQLYFPGDLGFEHVGNAKKTAVWGRNNA